MIRVKDSLKEVHKIQKSYSEIVVSVFKAGRGSLSPSHCCVSVKPSLLQMNCVSIIKILPTAIKLTTSLAMIDLGKHAQHEHGTQPDAEATQTEST